METLIEWSRYRGQDGWPMVLYVEYNGQYAALPLEVDDRTGHVSWEKFVEGVNAMNNAFIRMLKDIEGGQ